MNGPWAARGKTCPPGWKSRRTRGRSGFTTSPGEVAVNIRAEAGVAKKSDMGFLFVSDSVVSGEAPPEPVPSPSGVTDHRHLTHRDAEGQHPMGAIEGLKEALSRIPSPMTADELRKILMSEG